MEELRGGERSAIKWVLVEEKPKSSKHKDSPDIEVSMLNKHPLLNVHFECCKGLVIVQTTPKCIYRHLDKNVAPSATVSSYFPLILVC